MRQVGQLPRIIAWCTVNQMLNYITRPCCRPLSPSSAILLNTKLSAVRYIVRLHSMVWERPLQMISQPARWLPTVGIATLRLATEIYSNFVGSFAFILNMTLYFSYQITSDTLLTLTFIQATTVGTCMFLMVRLLLHFRFSLFYFIWVCLNKLILNISTKKCPQ